MDHQRWMSILGVNQARGTSRHWKDMSREKATSRRTDTVRSRHKVKIKMDINKCREDDRRVRINRLSEEL